MQCSQTLKLRLPSCVKLHGAGAGGSNSNTTTFTWDVNRSIPQVMDDGEAQYTYGLRRIAKLEAPSVEGSGTYLWETASVPRWS